MYKLVKHSDEIAGQAKNDWINQADDLGDVGGISHGRCNRYFQQDRVKSKRT